MENKFNDEEFLFKIDKSKEVEEAIHKQRLYLDILKDLDGDDFFIDYETYEEME